MKSAKYYKRGEASPSPYRIGWTPEGEHTRWVECPRGTRVEQAALRFARPYASNCGLAGRLDVQVRDGEDWRTIRWAPVKDSTAGAWCVTC